MEKVLITGITGQDGSYLTEMLLKKNYEIHGILRNTSILKRERIDFLRTNLKLDFDKLHLHYGDVTDAHAMTSVIADIRPHQIFNLAGQSNVALSFKHPYSTYKINAGGILNILEANRQTGVMAKVFHASSSEIFGSSNFFPQNEKTPVGPITPYGASKAYAQHICDVYRLSYGMKICCGIMYNHESPRRGENFVTRKIAIGVARIIKKLSNRLELGDVNLKRDWGYAPDYVDAMYRMMLGNFNDNFIIATGKSTSVKEFAEKAFKYCNLDPTKYISLSQRHLRPNDSNLLIGDYSKAKSAFDWEPKTNIDQMIKLMVDHELNQNR